MWLSGYLSDGASCYDALPVVCCTGLAAFSVTQSFIFLNFRSRTSSTKISSSYEKRLSHCIRIRKMLP